MLNYQLSHVSNQSQAFGLFFLINRISKHPKSLKINDYIELVTIKKQTQSFTS